ncbi:MAG: YybH family protein [Streptosporangiaceae bacterium]
MISSGLEGTGLEGGLAGAGLGGAGLGGAGLGGAGLEGPVAGWAADATFDDAAAVRAVIEAYGDRLAAADVAGVVSQFTGNGAAMQPGHETVVGSQQLTATYDAALENMRLDFTFRSDDITVQGDLAAVRATSQGTITIRATGETQPARLRQLFVLARTGADWKIAHYMYQLMPEQSGGGCSGI